MQPSSIIKEEKVFEDHLVIRKAIIRKGQHEFTRVKVDRPAAASVLVYNKEDDCMVLTRQFRYPVHHLLTEPALEIMAGIVDEGEEPEKAAVREAREEIGYLLEEKNLRKFASCFLTPGYSSEKLHHFYVEVTNKDKVEKGGGLKEEHEEIEILNMKRSEFERRIREQLFVDQKTLISGLWFLLNISPTLP
jgi:ADP-ribose pyrophosphatase